MNCKDCKFYKQDSEYTHMGYCEILNSVTIKGNHDMFLVDGTFGCKHYISKSDEHDVHCYMAECITCDYKTAVKSGKKAICGRCDTPMVVRSDI